MKESTSVSIVESRSEVLDINVKTRICFIKECIDFRWLK